MAEAPNKSPYFFPKWILALFPAVYAWQVYGKALGVIAFIATVASLYAIQFLLLWRGWPLRWLGRLRVTVVIAVMIIIGISAMQACNERGECYSVFGTVADGPYGTP